MARPCRIGFLSLLAGGSLSWRFDPHWTLVGTVANSVWPDGFGMNQDARIVSPGRPLWPFLGNAFSLSPPGAAGCATQALRAARLRR